MVGRRTASQKASANSPCWAYSSGPALAITHVFGLPIPRSASPSISIPAEPE